MTSNCGPGSSLKATQKLRRFLTEIVSKYEIKTINDAGCGDLYWLCFADLGVDYHGYDDNIREVAKIRAEPRGWKLSEINLLTDKMRPCDLIICKDVMRHHDLKGIDAILSQFNGEYLLADYNHEETNTGSHHRNVGDSLYAIAGNRVDLRPLLGEPLESIVSDEEGKDFGLWQLK